MRARRTDRAVSREQLNLALRTIWQNSSAHIDLIAVGGAQKRAINAFVASNRRYAAGGETFKDLVSTYESDFGVCRIVLCRAVPPGTVLLLDSSRIEVLPLGGPELPLQAAGPHRRPRVRPAHRRVHPRAPQRKRPRRDRGIDVVTGHWSLAGGARRDRPCAGERR